MAHVGFSLHSPPIRSFRTLKSQCLNCGFRKVCTVNSSLSSTKPSVSAAVESFWRWLIDKKVVSEISPIVKPEIVPEGLGIVAQRDISRNGVIMEVPKKLWINPDTVASSEIGRFCNGLKPWISVALFILREKSREDSQWRQYLDILPESTNSPIFWSEQELLELQGTQLLSTTLSVKDYIQREFLKIREEILEPYSNLFPPITLEDFTWAFGILRSRAFSRLRGENLVLIPLADLLNHSMTITTEDNAWEIKGTGLFSREFLFSLRTPVPVKAGEQVFIQYDLGKSNADLALDYGFVEQNLDRDVYTLTLGIPESDPFLGDKLDIAETNGLGETAYFDISLNQPLPPKMLPFLRLLALGGTDAFLLEAIFRNTIWSYLELPVSRANEEFICRAVRNACQSALARYPTTLEQDEKLKSEKYLDPKLEIAIRIREGEKKILQKVDQIFKERETELDGLEYYQERRLKDLGLVGEQDELIFWENK